MAAAECFAVRDETLLITITRDGVDEKGNPVVLVDTHRLADPEQLAAYDNDPEGFVKNYGIRYVIEAAANAAKVVQPEVVAVVVSEADVEAAKS